MPARLPHGMIRHWMEWKRYCALGLCSRPCVAELHRFAFIRFRCFVRRYADATGLRADEVPLPEPRDAWHLLETHVTVTHTREGKRYKDWLFGRVGATGGDSLDTVQGGASLIMRDVVRDFLRREVAPARTVSIHRPLFEGERSTLTVEDLLPAGDDPAHEAVARDYEELARGHVQEAFDDMTRKERVAGLAKALGLPLSHPAVQEAAGCRKSVLSSGYRAFIRRVGEKMKARYAGEDPESVLRLTLALVRQVHGLALQWGKSEKGYAGFFYLVGSEELDVAAATAVAETGENT